MKALHGVTAVIEAGAGLALLCCPSLTASLLLGSPLNTPPTITLARVAGAALLALGVSNGLATTAAQSTAQTGLIAAMILYNLATAAILALAGIQSQTIGIALWPAVILHSALAVWCILALTSQSRRKP